MQATSGRAVHDALDEAETVDAIKEALIRQKSAEVSTVEADIAVMREHARRGAADPHRR